MFRAVRWFSVMKLLSLAVVVVKGMPIDNQAANKAISFLSNYGYIGSLRIGNSNVTAASLIEPNIQTAISSMQRFAGIPVTGVLDRDTINLINSPRCGLPDIEVQGLRKRHYSLTARGWKKRRLSYGIQKYTFKLSRYNVQNDINKAFNLWQRTGPIDFIQDMENPNADIVITFDTGLHGDMSPFDGPGGALAHAFYPVNDSPRAGDIHFDNEEDWKHSDDRDRGVNLYAVAAHELGHSLGLGHSSDQKALMFPYYRGGDPVLGSDDIEGLYKLYGNNGAFTPTTPRPTTPDLATNPDGTIAFPTRFNNNPTTPRTTTRRTTTRRTTTPRRTTTTRRTTTARHTTSITALDEPPVCSQRFDATTVIRGDLFIFIGKWHYRMRNKGQVWPQYPTEFRRMWPMFPESIDRIDAVYERTDGKFVFFTGKQLWISAGSGWVENSPKPLTTLGLPDSLEYVDAALVWGKNKHTYIFSGSQYWKLVNNYVEERYPKDIAVWNGVPNNLDAALVYEGITYFFKDNRVWSYDDELVRVNPVTTAATDWIGC